MKIVGLLSGGKDSIYNLLQCIAAGHEVVAIANIIPHNKEEMDSYMYQSAGHEAISLVAACLGFPIFRQVTKGNAVCKNKTYTLSEEDEVEDLYLLLKKVKSSISTIEGVAVGAISSDYQRTRVENVAERLNLKCFAYLWKRDQQELLEEMIHCGIDAIIIKVAALGLRPDFHLGAHIREVKNNLVELNKKFGINICGEGGEYETLTLDCPLFTKKIRIIEHDNILLTNDTIAPVGILSVKNAILIPKPGAIDDPVLSQISRLNQIQKMVGTPAFYVEDCLDDLSDNSVFLSKNTEKFTLDHPSKSPSPGTEGSEKSLQRSKSKLINRMYSSSEPFSFDTTNYQLNYSSGWCFIGNITAATLQQGLSTLQNIIQVELFVRDISDFPEMNATYSEVMPKILPPARICVETCLQSEIGVLINVIAQKCISKSQKVLINTMYPEKQVIHVQSISHWAPANIGPYSQCVRVGDIYYVAGQIPLIPGSMKILNESFYSKCKLTLRHVLRILQAMTSNLTFLNVMQAVCYVTSEKLASMVVKMWTSITENVTATVTSVVVKELPKEAELEWQVIGCAFDEPEVMEYAETIGSYKFQMKRCLYPECISSSVICKVVQLKKKNKKSETELKLESVEELTTITKNCIRFLRAELQSPGSPLCMLKFFHEFDDSIIASVISEITRSSEPCKVCASGIPVLGGEEPGVCLTIVGVCH